MTDEQFLSYESLAPGLLAIFADARAKRDAWLVTVGLTLDQAKATTGEDREALEASYRSFLLALRLPLEEKP